MVRDVVVTPDPANLLPGMKCRSAFVSKADRIASSHSCPKRESMRGAEMIARRTSGVSPGMPLIRDHRGGTEPSRGLAGHAPLHRLPGRSPPRPRQQSRRSSFDLAAEPLNSMIGTQAEHIAITAPPRRRPTFSPGRIAGDGYSTSRHRSGPADQPAAALSSGHPPLARAARSGSGRPSAGRSWYGAVRGRAAHLRCRMPTIPVAARRSAQRNSGPKDPTARKRPSWQDPRRAGLRFPLSPLRDLPR